MSTFLESDRIAPEAERQVFGEAERLAASGRYLEAIDHAVELIRRQRDATLESRLVQWRSAAFADLDKSQPRPEWPPYADDPRPGVGGLYEITPDQLNLQTLAGGILHHGHVLVRGLFSGEEAERYAAGIDRAMAARDAALGGHASDEEAAWYTPYPHPEGTELGKSREWVESSGAVWTADSPRNLFNLIELFERKRIVSLIAEYLGERPALSMGKSTLRRVAASLNHTDWHQDGAFLGADVRSMNVWVALTSCGVDASGLDVVPRRIPHILETGTHGAYFPWSVGHGLAEISAQDTPITTPEFQAGDALLFDHLFLHRTGLPPGRTKDRWAIESWFFAPSSYPVQQGPLVI